jgi:hypothetical protein
MIDQSGILKSCLLVFTLHGLYWRHVLRTRFQMAWAELRNCDIVVTTSVRLRWKNIDREFDIYSYNFREDKLAQLLSFFKKNPDLPI